MKLVCWNVKVLKSQPREEIKILNCKLNPDILVLLKTMTNKINTDRLISKLGYEHFDYVHPEISVGGRYGFIE